MPGPASSVSYGNVPLSMILSLGAAPYPSFASSVMSTSSLFVPGVRPGDHLIPMLQSTIAHLALEGAFCTVKDAMIFQWATDTTGISSSGTAPVLVKLSRCDRTTPPAAV